MPLLMLDEADVDGVGAQYKPVQFINTNLHNIVYNIESMVYCILQINTVHVPTLNLKPALHIVALARC